MTLNEAVTTNNYILSIQCENTLLYALSVLAIDKRLVTTPNTRSHMLEKICDMTCESKVKYGAEIWGLVKCVGIVEGKRTGKVL